MLGLGNAAEKLRVVGDVPAATPSLVALLSLLSVSQPALPTALVHPWVLPDPSEPQPCPRCPDRGSWG